VALGEQVETAQMGAEPEREVARPSDRLSRWRDRLPATAELRGQGFRFVLVGGISAGVYVGTTTFLAEVIGVPFEGALAIGFALALITQFSLHRVYVWRHATAFALSLRHQFARYVAIAVFNYGVTAAITGTLPHALGVSPEVVYLPTVVALPVVNFFVFRSRIFHAAIDPLHR
jgi:putative flippase GtrA